MNILRLARLNGDRKEGKMFVTQATVQSAENAREALVLLAVGIAVFWRAALRIVIAIVLVAICIGAIMLLQGIPT